MSNWVIKLMHYSGPSFRCDPFLCIFMKCLTFFHSVRHCSQLHFFPHPNFSSCLWISTAGFCNHQIEPKSITEWSEENRAEKKTGMNFYLLRVQSKTKRKSNPFSFWGRHYKWAREKRWLHLIWSVWLLSRVDLCLRVLCHWHTETSMKSREKENSIGIFCSSLFLLSAVLLLFVHIQIFIGFVPGFFSSFSRFTSLSIRHSFTGHMYAVLRIHFYDIQMTR